ncbi:Uncharacterized protein XB15_02766 [Leptospira santarosai]|nr:Uncharacterized protein XB15_02766 [Leptospira santarosai]
MNLILERSKFVTYYTYIDTTHLYRIEYHVHFESNFRFETEFWTPGSIVLSNALWDHKRRGDSFVRCNVLDSADIDE